MGTITARLSRTLACVFVLVAGSFSTNQTVEHLKSNTQENLRGLSVVSEKIIWASGTHGTYVRTLDGGGNWTAAQVPTAESLDFRDVEAFSENVAYLLSAGPGDQSRIYKTADGGQHWALQFTNTNSKGFFDCMAFWNKDDGIALGDPVDGKFELISTSDGGAHWNALSTDHLPAAIKGEGAFAASGTCIAVEGKSDVWFATGGDAARVFHSNNRGKNWTVVDTPIAHGRETQGIFSIAFRDARHGMVVGGDYKNPGTSGTNIAVSDDGGRGWTASKLAPQGYFSAIAIGSGNRIITVGSDHTGYANNLNANTWRRYIAVGANAVRFLPEGDAISVGPHGSITRFDLH